MTRRSIVRFFVLMLHREVEKLGEILGDSSKKKSFNFIYSTIWQNFTYKLGFLIGYYHC